MQAVVSRINKLYIGKVIALHFFAFLGVAVCSKYLENIYNIEKRIFALVMLFVISVFLFIVWQEVLSRKKIIVDSYGIKVYNAISLKEISFSEIQEIKIHKFRIQLNPVPITDGYSYSEIIITRKPSLTISPEKFENYAEIMSAIKENLK